MAKVLFITDQYQIDPLGIGYLSSSLLRAGHRTSLVQLPRREDGFDVSDAISHADAFCPDFLAYSVTTGMHKLWRQANLEIKRNISYPRVYSLFGGSHCTFFPNFADQEGVDIICAGEGEKTIVELADSISTTGAEYAINPLTSTWGLPDLSISNLSFNGGPHNPVGHLPDIDYLPWPDRKLLYRYPRNALNPIRNVLASRGCPFNCPYCYNKEYRELYKGKGKTRRLRDPEDIVEEIIALIEDFPNTKLIYFQDDVFTIPRKWFHEVTTLYARKVTLPYHCHLRADTLSKEDVQQLIETGCHGVTFAIESGDPLLRFDALGRKMTDEQILQAANWIHEAGLRLRTENMIGLPYETVDRTWKTIKLNQKCKPNVPWASLYQPYPGTALGKLAEDIGLCKLDPETVQPSFFEDLVLNLPHKNRLINLQKFFGVAVAHPKLNWAIKMLSLLPPNRYFQKFSYTWRRRRYRRALYDV